MFSLSTAYYFALKINQRVESNHKVYSLFVIRRLIPIPIIEYTFRNLIYQNTEVQSAMFN